MNSFRSDAMFCFRCHRKLEYVRPRKSFFPKEPDSLGAASAYAIIYSVREHAGGAELYVAAIHRADMYRCPKCERAVVRDIADGPVVCELDPKVKVDLWLKVLEEKGNFVRVFLDGSEKLWDAPRTDDVGLRDDTDFLND